MATTWPPTATGSTLIPQGGTEQPTTEEYVDGVEAEVSLPRGTNRAPILVVIPGWGMGRSRPAGLSPLPADLANLGLLVFNAIYRAASREIGRSALDPSARPTPRSA